MTPDGKHLYRFGEFSLNTEHNVLLRGDKPLALTPKMLELLRVLVENHGRILKKDDLMETVWANSIVEEGNLRFTVNQLRKLLGDDAHNPLYIETVPRRGYRFIAEVNESSPVEENSTRAQTTSIDRKKRQPLGRTLLLAAALFLVLFGIVAASLWLARNRSFLRASTAPVLAAPFRTEKLSSTGKVYHAAISPDGRLVAYVSKSGGKSSVWLRRLETSENFQIVPPSDNLYHGLIFAHDGNSIFFVRKPPEESAPTAVYQLSIFGGIPQKITEGSLGWISLSPDDRLLSFVRCEYRDEDYCSLFVADADGRNERKILTKPSPFRIGDNQFSPDGKSIGFVAGESLNGGSDFRLLRVDFASGAEMESEISPKCFFNIKNVEWLGDGENLLVTAKETFGDKFKIWRISLASGEAAALTRDAADYGNISSDKNADKIVATQIGNNFQLYFSENGTSRALTAAMYAVFAPDGEIVYSTEEGDIWTINPESGEQRQLTNNPLADYLPQVSPGNHFIYFTSNRTGANQVWRMNRDGSNQTQLTTKEGGYPRFVSADGKWIYYESGLHETLWRVSADGGEETQISEAKMYSPVFSPDGNLAAYFFRDKEWKIGVMNLSDQTMLKTPEFGNGKLRPMGTIAWSADNQTLNFITDSNGKNLLWEQSLDEANPRFVADLGDGEIENLALAPGGGSFAYTRGEWLHDAVLITGFK